MKTLENEQLEKRGEAAESPPPAEESPDYCCTTCRAARPAEWICSGILFGFANEKSESAREICREHVCEVGGEIGGEVGREVGREKGREKS